MKTELFNFELPESLIADRPANPRDSARMLVVDDAMQDMRICDLPSFLKPGDVMVFNDTRVIPARLFGKRGQSNIEILLHKKKHEGWVCFAKPAKRLKAGDEIVFGDDFKAVVNDKFPDGQVLLRFEGNMANGLALYGHMPLPPYIEKKRHAADSDSRDYQTVYAAREGSVAAPTAGLHFTPDLLKAIDGRGAARVHVTLHVGGGTFLPVKVDDTNDHVMHSEWAEISAQAAGAINAAKAKGGRIIAVGTTSLRTLESAADENGLVHPFSGETDIFITPGYRFKTADLLVTNFHLPKSTLFMLVSAFSGLARMKTAYAHAIAHAYRFYSYGDACLLYKHAIGDSGK